MKTNHRIIPWLSLLALLSTINYQLSTAHAQGTAFSYQGQLTVSGAPANGGYDLTFALFSSSNGVGQVGNTLTNLDTGVTNGLFAVTLDFGSGVFTGESVWLQVGVRTNGGTAFTTLAPLQPILPVPYAVMANSASNLLGTLPSTQLSGAIPATNLTGMVSLAQLPAVVLTNNDTSITLSGTFSGNGAGLTGVPGSIPWVNVSGTSQQAQPNTGYLADNNAAQVTITLPTTPNLGDIVRVSGAGAGGWIIAQNAGQSILAGQFGATSGVTNWNGLINNWTWTSAPSTNWSSIASSSDGTKLAAASGEWLTGPHSPGTIWISADSGGTWAPTSAPGTNWNCIASSADGTKLAAGVGYYGTGGVYTSTNSGVTWTQTSAPSTGWSSIASSSDGTKLAAAGAGIYTSTNSGATWTQTSAPSTGWSSIASSSDGTKLAAAGTGTGTGIYTSTNSGATWTQTSAPTTNYWDSIASSADGTKLAAAEEYELGVSSIYTSTNSGLTWTQTSPYGVFTWLNCIASSADGTKLAAGAWDGNICISTNSGVNWSAYAPALGDLWVSLAFSADGTKLWALGQYDGIFAAQAPILLTTTPGTAGYLAGGQNSAIELQYIGNSQFMSLSHEGTILAH